ncbi:MAG: hypothetical protein ABIF18_02495 [archaeon]
MKKEQVSKLDPIKFAFATAITVAFLVFIITIGALVDFFGAFSFLTSIISDIYGGVGYSVSLIGSCLGAVYIFIDVFIITYAFAWLYNKML